MGEFEYKKGLKKDFSFSSCLMMIKMLNFAKKEKHLTSAKIATLISTSQSDINFRELVSYLKKLNIIKEIDLVGNSRILTINGDLKDFIDEQEIITWLVDNFYKKHHSFRW